MDEIGHHVLRDFSVELDEKLTKVAEVNRLAFDELMKRLVDLQGFGPLLGETLVELEEARQNNARRFPALLAIDTTR